MKKTFYLFILLSVFSCGKVKQIDTTDIKEVMRNSKVKRVTEKDLLSKVGEIGDSLSMKLNGDFRVECQSKYSIDGQKIELYNAGLLSQESLQEGVKGQLLEAYKYAIENGQHVGSNIQTLSDTLYAYSFPLNEKSYLKKTCGQDFALIIISKTEVVKQL